MYEKVVPRLLRPLETEGRTLKPCLVHGDFWDGNTAVAIESGQLYMFDSGAFWGHNECKLQIVYHLLLRKAYSPLDDLASCRPARSKLGRPFMEEYFKHFPITPPEEDWEDRNLLYSL